MRVLMVLLCLTLLTGCQSLELRNLGKSGASAIVAYTINPLAGIASLATSMAYDEIIPDEPSIDQIETNQQATAFIAKSLFMNLLYFGVAWMLITLIAVPFIHRRGYIKAKKKYKVLFKSDEVLNERINK